MSGKEEDLIEQLDRHLASPCQSWLFGAGSSVEAGIPLMGDLTTRIRKLAETTEYGGLLDAFFEELPPSSNIEVVLSHLGDLVSLSARTKSRLIKVADVEISPEALREAHLMITRNIAVTIMSGYRPAIGGSREQIGSSEAPIVTIDQHLAFANALFHTGQAGLADRRGPVRLFTTNYDTLLEDSLSLSQVSYWDGFTGGAVAYRSFHFGETEPSAGYRAHVVKLHGSIDWHLDEDGRIWRVRRGDLYPKTNGRVLIYPQATKYVATQRDPFATQFDLFRRALASLSDNVLPICGYSFSDEHINQEIELAMMSPSNRTTIIAFYNEKFGWKECLTSWRKSTWGNRLYVLTEKGLYVGEEGPFLIPTAGTDRTWWTFNGVVRLLVDGAEGVLA